MFILFHIGLCNVFLYQRNTELAVCNACFISIFAYLKKFYFTLDSTNVYHMFCLAGSKMTLLLQLFQLCLHGRYPDSKLMVTRCVRYVRHIQKTAPSVVEHQDIGSNNDVFAELLV